MKNKQGAGKAGRSSKPSPEALRDLYALLRKTEPTDDRYDVVWPGPFWVDGEGRWRPTWFSVRRGVLTGQIVLARGGPLMKGDLQTGEIEWVKDAEPGWPSGEDHWPEAFSEIHDELAVAVRDFDAYNAEVEREMPLASRTGKIERRMTWTEGEERVPPEQIASARAAARSAAKRPPLPALSTGEYLRIAEIAYDAASPEERRLSREEKHRRRADSRHGGMLNLPPDDAVAFRAWFESREWQGAHPFEIVYGYPHGVTMWPNVADGGWTFRIGISDELYRKDGLAMAIALDQAEIPFEFGQIEGFAKAFEGLDDVEIGPYRGQLPLEELRKSRPDAVAAVRWDPLRKLAPVTPGGLARIAWIEEHGTMAGFEKNDE